ncbi:MAG TPA: hypothetical protein VK173_08485 [Lacibacter sp.]|nr:hypothetical protein [Lacibacter sp.]
MKIKNIILILVGLLIIALIGANIYDFLKPAKKVIAYTDFENKTPSISDSIENYRFLTHFEYDVSGRSVISTYIFINDLLEDSTTNIIAQSRTIDCRAYKTVNDGFHLIYLTAINQDERNSGRHSIYITKKIEGNWETKELLMSDVLRDSVLAKNVERIAVLR